MKKSQKETGFYLVSKTREEDSHMRATVCRVKFPFFFLIGGEEGIEQKIQNSNFVKERKSEKKNVGKYQQWKSE